MKKYNEAIRLENRLKIQYVSGDLDSHAAHATQLKKMKQARNKVHRCIRYNRDKRMGERLGANKKQKSTRTIHSENKMIHSEIQTELGNGKDSQVEASKVTMNFDGFKVGAKGKKGISSVLTSYTKLVLIDELSNKEAILKEQLKGLLS